jgi:hypothetical protein
MAGQVNLLLLLFLLPFIHCVRTQKDGIAGVLLGGMLSIKLFGWPFLVFFLLSRRFKAFAWATGTALATWTAATLCLGAEIVSGYLSASRSTTALYMTHADNFSLLSLVRRLFGGFEDIGQWVFEEKVPTPPILFHLPFASEVSALFGVALIGTLIWWLSKHRTLGTTVYALIALSVIANPVSWYHTRLLMLPLLPFIVEKIRLSSTPAAVRSAAWVVIAAAVLGVARITGATFIESPPQWLMAWVLLGESVVPLGAFMVMAAAERESPPPTQM